MSEKQSQYYKFKVSAYRDSAVVSEEPLLPPVDLTRERVQEVDGDALHEALLVPVSHAAEQDLHHTLVFEQLQIKLSMYICLKYS